MSLTGGRWELVGVGLEQAVLGGVGRGTRCRSQGWWKTPGSRLRLRTDTLWALPVGPVLFSARHLNPPHGPVGGWSALSLSSRR